MKPPDVTDSLLPPQPWKTPTTGKSPSGPLAGAGGKPTLMSIGAPSKVVKMPEQWRWPAFAPVWTVQVMSPPAPLGMFGIAAGACAGSISAHSNAASTTTLDTARLASHSGSSPYCAFSPHPKGVVGGTYRLS